MDKIESIDRQPILNVIELTVAGAGKGVNSDFVWQVGREYGIGRGRRVKCSSIRHDANSYFFNGQSRWTVYVELENGEECAYVHYENAELHIKCDIPKII